MTSDDYEFNISFSVGQAAYDLNALPEQEPEILPAAEVSTPAGAVTVSSTKTYQRIRDAKKARRANLISGILLAVTVLLGVVAVVRYASIFEINRATRNLTAANTKADNRLSLAEHAAEGNAGTRDVSKIAARLGMVKASERDVVTVNLEGGDPTRIYLNEETRQEDESFYRTLMIFLGQITFD